MSNVTRFKKNNFTITDNKLIKDERLSWKARGIFQYLWAMPDDWNFYVDEVAKHSKDGVKSLKSGLAELEKYGYLKRITVRNEKGLFDKMLWKLSDTGDFTVSTIFGPTDKTVDGKNGPTDNGALLNKKSTNKKEILNTTTTARDSLSTTHKYIDSESNNAYQLYQINVGMLSGTQTPIFTEYVKNLSDEVVQFAINLMLDHTSKPNFKYLEKILMNYERLNIHTVEDAQKVNKQHKEHRKRQQSKTVSTKRHIRDLGW